jgi:hypothetical protein
MALRRLDDATVILPGNDFLLQKVKTLAEDSTIQVAEGSSANSFYGSIATGTPG